MTVKTLVLKCECGGSSSSIRELGLTAERELLMIWVCPECERQAYEVMPLADCWRDCPSGDQSDNGEALDQMLQTAMQDVQERDARFLQSLGVEPI
jgi:hypothetical protein